MLFQIFKKSRKSIFLFGLVLLSILLIPSVLAAPINDTFHINLQTTFSNGTIETGTFSFAFNITESSSATCDSPIVYNHSTSLSTDSRGIVSLYLPTAGTGGGNLSQLDFDKQYYLCYYRDSTLKSVSQLGRVPYSFRATQVNLSEIGIDSNLNLTDYNITDVNTGFFDFLGSVVNRITKIFVTDLDVDNNVSVGGNLSVDNRVGIGTNNPSQILDVIGGIQIGNTANAEAGAIRWTGSQFQAYNGTDWNAFGSSGGGSPWSSNGSNIYYDSGSVGIGTTSPSDELNVVGNTNVTGNVSASWFKGIFNWIVGGSSTDYLSFNGTQLDFSETQLNTTIDLRDDDTLAGLGCADTEVAKWNSTSSAWECSSDLNTNSTLYYAGGIYIYKNASNYFILNETKLNETGDIRYVNEGQVDSITSSMINDGSVGNIDLTNSNLTIISGQGLTGGGVVSLGENLTLDIGAGQGINVGADSVSIAFGDNFLGWTNLTDYPAGCPAGHAIQQINDTLTCVNISSQGSGTLDGYDSSFFMPLNTSVYGDFDWNGGWQNGGLSIIGGNIYAQTGFFYNLTSLSVTNLEVNGSLVPDLDNLFDLGNSSYRWRNLFLSGDANITGNIYQGNNLVLDVSDEPSLNVNSSEWWLTNEGALDNVADILGSDITNDLNWINASEANGSYILQSDEGNLNVNSSDFWDDLNTPSDISIGDLNDDGTYLLATGDTATGNYTFDTNTFFIDSTNNRVGIGTISPSNLLEIGDASLTGFAPSFSNQFLSGYETSSSSGDTLNALIYSEQNSATTGSLQGLEVYTAITSPGTVSNVYGSISNVELNSGGNLTNARSFTGGIGTGSSSSGTISNAYVYFVQNGFNTGSGSIDDYYGLYVSDLTAGSSNNWAIYTNGNTPSYFGGNVGIGTNNPSQLLDVAGKIQLGNDAATAEAGVIRWTGSDFQGYNGTSWNSFASGGSGTPSPWTENGSTIYYTGGDVGIGTMQPQQRLNVVGDANITGLLRFGNLLTDSINTTHILDGTILNTDLTSDLNLGWSNLTNYPVACSSSETITSIGDTITCSSISITESQISDLQTYIVNNTGGNVANFSKEIYQAGNLVCDDSNNCNFISQNEEGNLNVNSSDFWDGYDVASDLNNLVLLHWDNITNKNPSDFNFRILLNQENITNEDWIEDSQEPSLNVNSSDFWDELNTPGDILGSSITNDLNWINTSGETDPIYVSENGTIARVGDCPSGQFVQNTTTGGVECATPTGAGDITSVQGDDIYIYNGSTSGDVQLVFNETRLNSTIDLRSSGGEDTDWNVSGSNLFPYDLNYNVGIGTNSPESKLNVKGIITANNGSGDAIFCVDNEACNDRLKITSSSNDQIEFIINSDTKLFINQSGSVGIGTISPASLLDVGGGTANNIDGTNDLLVADDLEVDGTIYGDGSGITGISYTETDPFWTGNFSSRTGTGNVVFSDSPTITTAINLPSGAVDAAGEIANNIITNAHFAHSTDWGDVSTDGSGNVQIDSGTVSDTEVSSLSWIELNNYPAACSSSETITSIGDTITCSSISISGSQVSDDGTFLLVTGDTATGDITFNNPIHLNDVDSIYFENDQHAITYNDGQGNFNIRVGHVSNASVIEEVTEAGYPIHMEWSQGSGNWQVNIDSTSRSVGDIASWDNTLQFDNTGELSINGDFDLEGDILISEDDFIGLSASTERIEFNGGSGLLEILGANLDLNNNNITGIDKLTANTIDPVYNINGINYATYAPFFAGGNKEEVTGTIVLSESNSYKIDFDNLQTGSDLWLFSKVTSFGKDWVNLQIILTPGFNGRVWYTKNIEENSITIYGNQNGEVSYRMTANRFDWNNQGNLANQEEKGIIIPY